MRFATFLLLSLLLLLPQSSKAQTCADPLASADLDVSGVRATLFNNGGLFDTNTTGFYQVPKNLETEAVFSSGLWVGGDINGELRFAGADYNNWEFWPGPLDDGATLPEFDCRRTNANGREAWDRIYVVSTDDVAAYEMSAVATNDLADWPVGLGAPTVDAFGDPVDPADRDQLIDLSAGERPVVYGSQTAFWVMNDKGNTHLWSGAAPLGIEVQVSAFAIADGTNLPLYQSTFYRYRIINRSNDTIQQAYLSFWADADLGNSTDDYVGSDSTRGLGFTYNATGYDAGPGNYGFSPPALGVDLLSSAGNIMYYSNENSPTGNPDDGVDAYNYMRAFWDVTTPMTEGGDGYNTGGPVTTYAFPGAPEDGAFWSEINPDNSGFPNRAGDRRFLVSPLPLTLQPGESYTMDVAVLFAFASGYLSSIAALRAASDDVQARYDAGTLYDTVVPSSLPAPPTIAPDLDGPDDGTVFTEGDVVFSWTIIPDADYYVIESNTTNDFETPERGPVSGTMVTLSRASVPPNRTEPFYWRVRGANTGGLGPPSEVRSFMYNVPPPPPPPGPLLLSNGNLAFVEVVGPGGADPCGPDATSTFGCDEVGGNWIYPSFNGTGEYMMHHVGAEGPEEVLIDFVPNEFEIRWTEEGSYAASIFDSNTLIHIPFEVWDIGLVVPGQENDPSDDIQLIPAFFGDGGGECAFNFGETEDLELPATDRIYAYYPQEGMSHDDWVAYAQPLVDANAGCAPAPAGDGANYYVIADEERGRPIQRVVFLDNTGTGDLGLMQGSVQRFYTTDMPVNVEGEPNDMMERYRLSPAYPNPFAQHTTIPFALPRAGHARLIAYDLLGRQVAVLHEGPVAAGTHEATLSAQGLASGVYVVVLEAEGAVQTRQKVLLLR